MSRSKKSCKTTKAKAKHWKLERGVSASYEDNLLIIEGMYGSVELGKAGTRKLYQRLSGLYKD